MDTAEKITELSDALRVCIVSINPPDRGGISLSEWNNRLKGATKVAEAALASVEGRCPECGAERACYSCASQGGWISEAEIEELERTP